MRTIVPDRNLGALAQCVLFILDCKDVILSDGLPLTLEIWDEWKASKDGVYAYAANEYDVIVSESQNGGRNGERNCAAHSEFFISTGQSQSSPNQAKIDSVSDLSNALDAWNCLSKKSGTLSGPKSCKSSYKNVVFDSFCADLPRFSHHFRSRRGYRSQYRTMHLHSASL